MPWSKRKIMNTYSAVFKSIWKYKHSTKIKTNTEQSKSVCVNKVSEFNILRRDGHQTGSLLHDRAFSVGPDLC